MRYFLVDDFIPTIEISSGNMVSLSDTGSWSRIDASEVIGDEGSPEVTYEVIVSVVNRLGASMPNANNMKKKDLQNLVFKDGASALDYIEKFFIHTKLKKRSSFFGVIKNIDHSHQPSCMIEIITQTGILTKKVRRTLVVGVMHPEADLYCNTGDLVQWGFDKKIRGIPTGFILRQYSLELDISAGTFKESTKGQRSEKQFSAVVPESAKPNQSVTAKPDNSDGNPSPERWSEQELETAKKAGFDIEKLKSDAEELSDEEWSRAGRHAKDLWRRELDDKYGQILRRSEILDDGENFYFHYKKDAEHHRLVGWNKINREWFVEVRREQLEGLNFAPARLFDEAVFPEQDEGDSYYNKQDFINYLFFSCVEGSPKSLSKRLDEKSSLSFKIDALKWNKALLNIGSVSRDSVTITKQGQQPTCLKCTLLLMSGEILISTIEEDPEDNKTILNCSIRSLGGYYSR